MLARGLPLSPPGDGKGSIQHHRQHVSRKSGDRFRYVHQPRSRGGNGGASSMFTPFRRHAAFLPLHVSPPLRARILPSKMTRVRATLALLLCFFTTAAHAVI